MGMHLFGSPCIRILEGTLIQDMTTLLAYFQTCMLKLSHTKMVMSGVAVLTLASYTVS